MLQNFYNMEWGKWDWFKRPPTTNHVSLWWANIWSHLLLWWKFASICWVTSEANSYGLTTKTWFDGNFQQEEWEGNSWMHLPRPDWWPDAQTTWWATRSFLGDQIAPGWPDRSWVTRPFLGDLIAPVWPDWRPDLNGAAAFWANIRACSQS